MVSALPEQYLKAFTEQHDDSWLANWEALALGLTHAEVGAWLAGRWQLDSYLADALLYHHEPAERVALAHPLVRITWLAHALDRDPELDVAAFGLEREALLRVLDGVDAEVEKAARFLGVDLTRVDADTAARAQLAEVVRPLALAGAQQEARVSPDSELLPRLQAVMTAARSLYGLGDGILYQPQDGRLQGRVAWLHLARLEELEVPLGPHGGCVGMAAGSGRVATSWDADRPSSILDDQLSRVLGGEGLLCLPLGGAVPAAVLAFALDKDKAQALRLRPLLLENFAKEALASLDLAEKPAVSDPGALQERLRRAVHEANNPLGIIKNYLHILGERLAGQEVATDIALLKAEIDRVGRILNGLTAPTAKREASRGKGVDLNRTAQELVAFCRDTGFIPAGIQVELALGTDIPPVQANPDSLKQVLLNLVKNAVEVLGDRGRIGITTSGPVLQAGGSHVLLRVADDGPGMPAEVRERLFQPVESRKGGDHAGLGLAIVGELVKRLQGRIECRSGPTGTVFEILLPVAASAVGA
jgi:signal transduction histidine kinase